MASTGDGVKSGDDVAGSTEGGEVEPPSPSVHQWPTGGSPPTRRFWLSDLALEVERRMVNSSVGLGWLEVVAFGLPSVRVACAAWHHRCLAVRRCSAVVLVWLEVVGVVWLTSGVVVLTLVLAQRVYRAGIWSGKAVLGLWSRRLSGRRGGDGSGEACLWVPTFIWEGVFMHGGEESESAKAGVGPLIAS